MRLIMMSNKGNETSNIVCLSLLVLNFSFPASSSKQPVARVPSCSNHTFLVQATMQEKTDHCIIVWNFDANRSNRSCSTSERHWLADDGATSSLASIVVATKLLFSFHHHQNSQ
jgi:hypothetical protein